MELATALERIAIALEKIADSVASEKRSEPRLPRWDSFFSDLSSRARNALVSLNIKGFDDLLQFPSEALLAAKGCGETTRREVVSKLAMFGAAMSQEWPPRGER